MCEYWEKKSIKMHFLSEMNLKITSADLMSIFTNKSLIVRKNAYVASLCDALSSMLSPSICPFLTHRSLFEFRHQSIE